MSDTNANRPKPRRARGLMDRRGPGLALERGLIQRIAKVYETWGFEPLETPAFEYADALGKFLPDQDRPNEGVFALQDDDEQWLALRYDLTAPLARFVAENFDALPKPYRRWAAGPVWRNEKPGPGRFREFWQCDADTVGAASPAADAEMIAVACAGLEAAGVKRGGYQVKFSTRKLLDAVLENIGIAADAYSTRLVVLRAIDKFDRLGRQGVELLLGDGRKDESGDFTKGAGLDAKQRAAVIDLVMAGAGSRGDVLARLAKLAGEAAIAELREIDAALSALGMDDAAAAIDPTIVRGLEYYTGAVFEAQLIGEGGANFGSVGGGGRYDDLVSRFRGERIPATGFSIGVSRLAAALQAQAAAEADGPVVVLVMDQARIADALGMAAELRAAGVRAEAYLGGGGMKAQLKYADKRAAPVAVIQGGDELAKGVVTLKDLKLGARIASEFGEDREAYAKAREKVQQDAPRAQLVAAVKSMLG
ncbi:histidine--tRNA ligase [Vitreimonas flagellata]|uniref:histidine--tRNA ligase n=1 Tax=Vitreimonas flagellata TaxID=2560861 RepID=UPI001074E981|nr:histidine--tRNA ligase [Vitreimonas flagellata]